METLYREALNLGHSKVNYNIAKACCKARPGLLTGALSAQMEAALER